MGKLTARQMWAAGVVIGAVLIAAVAFSIARGDGAEEAVVEFDEIVDQALAEATPAPSFASQVYEVILPSLVLIQATGGTANNEGFGLGTGVVINADGAILTAHHVIADAAQIEVIFSDGTIRNATVAAAQPENDMATLSVEEGPQLIVPAIIGSPDRMRIGDETFAVGHPLGLTGSLSAGVISGFDRSIPIGEDRLDGLIQFDAAVNPGNSGGPLLNRDGQVIGIVTALASVMDDEGFSGIGFAVPIATAVGGGLGPAQ